MCRICGYFGFSNSLVDKGILDKMTNSLLHRGPDDQAFKKNDNHISGKENNGFILWRALNFAI